MRGFYFLRIIVAIRRLGVSLIVVLLPTSAMANTQPNILLVIADDMGLDASPCHNVSKNQVSMPNLKTLCDNGMVFDNAYSAPVCSPTRATIMTGKYGFRTGVGAAIPRTGREGLSVDETSLFDLLEDTNYSGAVIGKWHLAGSDDSLNHPAQLGVKEYYGIFKGAVRDYFNWDAVHNGENRGQVSGYTTTVLTDRAIDWIEAQNNPWFLWLAYNAPHRPFHEPPEDLLTDTSLTDDEDAIRANPLPYYNAALEALDSEMGRLLNSLDEETRNNTVVIFLGDNGTPNRVADDVYHSRGAKGGIFQGGTNVPLVFSGRDIEKGRSSTLVNTTDLYATIASFAGLSAGTSDSYNLRSLMEDQNAEDAKETNRKYAYIEHFSGEPAKRRESFGWAIRDARYKLVQVDGQEPMLFDLEADPFEKTDLLAGNPSEAIHTKANELLAAYQEIKE
ncbi:MAG: sulfatase-like hydrolase/transferase [Cyanobacteria bacterium P01_A01_bin.40]